MGMVQGLGFRLMIGLGAKVGARVGVVASTLGHGADTWGFRAQTLNLRAGTLSPPCVTPWSLGHHFGSPVGHLWATVGPRWAPGLYTVIISLFCSIINSS